MTALTVLPIVALITLCLVYLYLRADAALDRRARDWVRWERSVETFGELRRVWRRL